MLTCLKSSKQVNKGGDESQRTPSKKESVKGLKEKIKDITLKILGSDKHNKPFFQCFRLTQTCYKHTGSEGYYCGDPSQQGGNQIYSTSSRLHGVARPKGEVPSTELPQTTIAVRDEASLSNNNANGDIVSECIKKDEPGVYITIKQLADGTRELGPMKFSREKFNEVNVRLWWEQNKDRIQAQYL